MHLLIEGIFFNDFLLFASDGENGLVFYAFVLHFLCLCCCCGNQWLIMCSNILCMYLFDWVYFAQEFFYVSLMLEMITKLCWFFFNLYWRSQKFGCNNQEISQHEGTYQLFHSSIGSPYNGYKWTWKNKLLACWSIILGLWQEAKAKKADIRPVVPVPLKIIIVILFCFLRKWKIQQKIKPPERIRTTRETGTYAWIWMNM